MLRPCAASGRPSANGDIKAAPKLFVQCCRRRHRHFDVRSPGIKKLKTRNQPAKGKGRRSADAQEMARGGAPARLGGCRHPIEG